ncbi:hypothetical protein RJZ90_005303 [Blastomyces dermatitidis]
MYACPSAYLVYPPDPTGRRPSQHALLQYVSPEDRRNHDNLRLIQEQLYNDANSSRNTQRSGGANEGYRTILNEPSGPKGHYPEKRTEKHRCKDSQAGKSNDKTPEKKK